MPLRESMVWDSPDIRSACKFKSKFKEDGLLLPMLKAFAQFNHQTHHRGQVTTLLSQMGVDIGVTDLVHILNEGPIT